jgi:hypothetical protein
MNRAMAIFYSHVVPASFALFLGVTAIMAIDRASPSTMVWGKVIPPVVDVGQIVTFHYGQIKHSEYGGVVHRSLIDSAGVIFYLSDSPVVNDQIKKLNVEQEIIKEFPIPYGMSPGPAKYYSDAELYKKWNYVQWAFPTKNLYSYSFDVRRPIDGRCKIK